MTGRMGFGSRVHTPSINRLKGKRGLYHNTLHRQLLVCRDSLTYAVDHLANSMSHSMLYSHIKPEGLGMKKIIEHTDI